MNPIKYFWTNPIPESLFWPIKQIFKRISAFMGTKPISSRRYIFQCVIISIISFAALFVLTGTSNPLEFFVSIPIYDLNDFNILVGGDEYALYTYMIVGAIVIAVVIYLLRLFLFNGKEYGLFSVNGIFFEVMVVLVAALLDIPIQKLAYIYAMEWLPSIEGMGLTGTIILGFSLWFALYFAIQDSFSTILSSALAVELIMIFQDKLHILTSNRLLQLFVVTVIVRFILELVDMSGLWEKFTAFCGKWFYTPKYLIELTFFMIVIIFWCMSYGSREKNKER